jgi:hypothetical protein
MGPPNYAGRSIRGYGNRHMTPRPAYGSMGTGPSRARDRDRFNARRRSFENWYLNSYPAWLGYGYPYVIDPGFYNWGDSDTSGYDGSGAVPNYLAPYPDYGYGAPEEIPPPSAENRQRAAEAASPASAPAPEQTLTVIFKSGRAPVKMRNYMMTAKVLTDLDSQQHEQISMDQIDVAATQRVNSAAGVGFEIPGATRN